MAKAKAKKPKAKAKKPKARGKKKHAGGRPSKFKPEYTTNAHVKRFIAKCKRDKEVVTLCGYAVYIGVSEECLAEWGRTRPKFSGTLAKIKQISKNQLFQGGLDKTLSSRIVKLGLSANHGMNEKTESEITGAGGGPVMIVNYEGAAKK